MKKNGTNNASLSMRRVWTTWLAVCVFITAGAVGIFLHERDARIAEVSKRLQTEAGYLAHLLSANLRAGEFERIPDEIEAWGRLNSETVMVRLTADNGFILGEFIRDTDKRYTQSTTKEIPFSYHNIATLRLDKSIEPANEAVSHLGVELVFGVGFLQLIGFVAIYQLYRYRHQVRLAQTEYERRLEMQRAMEEMATHDALTGLPNRQVLIEQMDSRIAEARRFKRKLAVLFIDLDNFKHINDTFGHSLGDELLKVASKRMLACLRSYDLLVRFAGDEFVVVLTNIADTKEVDRVATKLIATMRPRVEIDDHEMQVSASIGISLFPDDCDTAQDLLRQADAAMYTAKEAGRNCFRYYTSALNEAVQYRQEIERGLHRALTEDSLYLLYQPKLNLINGTVSSCEALLRWRADGREILPTEFLPIAERSILLHEIESLVIEKAVRQRAEWTERNLGDLRIDINLSGRMLLNRETFALLDQQLREHHVPYRQIGIELSEQQLIEATDDMLGQLEVLRNQGSCISLDDFGTGYSSLGNLQELPVDVLKIDHTFIGQLPDQAHNDTFVDTMITMGQSLGKRVLAEGVETEKQMRFVGDHGCDLAQGFLIAQPMSAEKLIEWITHHRHGSQRTPDGYPLPPNKTTDPSPS